MNLSDQLSGYLRMHGVVNIKSKDNTLCLTFGASGYPTVYTAVITRELCLIPIVIASVDMAKVLGAVMQCTGETVNLFFAWATLHLQIATSV